MERKMLTVRLSSDLHDALSTLSGVTKRSMNRLVTTAVERFVLKESDAQARNIEETLERLRSYRDSDPGFERALSEFVEAEVEHPDPLEGHAYDTSGPVRARVAALLTDA